MNPITDERLMAYADDEVDAVERESIESALRRDPALAARVRELKQQRARLQAGLQAELDMPVPQRLHELLDAPPAPVIDLAGERRRRDRKPPPRSTWWQWGGMAASLLLGVLIARSWPGSDGVPFEQQAGRLVAAGAVAQALSTQLASEGMPATVAVQLSFVDRAGTYCRTFSFESSAGLACRERDAWVLQTVVATEAATAGALRQAASSLPPALLEVVDRRIAGDALDAQAERVARDRGWQR